VVGPANPYGWLLPWPSEGDGEPNGGKPRRVPNASVVFAGGELVFYLGNGGKHMLTFPAARDPERLASATSALRASTEQRRGKFLRVELIDGRPAQSSELASQLLALQWKSGYRGLELESR
jgi:ATP-dependent helicase Lhr and Lhr-like helicase